MVTSYVRYQYNLSTSFNCEPWTWIRSYISHEKGSCHFLKLLTLKKTWAQCNRLYVSKYVLRWLDVNLIGQSTILQLVKSKGLHLICFILLQTEYIYDSDFWFDKQSESQMCPFFILWLHQKLQSKMSLEIQSENVFQSASSNVEGEKDYFCTIAWRRWEELEMRKLYMDIKEYHKENSLKAIPLGLSTQKWVCKGWDYVVAKATVLL